MSGPAAACRLLAFDLDGVLYSSEPFLGEAYREAIGNVNRRRPGSFARVPATREILDHIGWPLPVILDRLFPDAHPQAIALLHEESLVSICARVAAGNGILYPGVSETLKDFHRSGFVLALASNGRRRYLQTVLATYEIAAYFVDIITADEAGDKATLLGLYLQRLGAAPARTVMIGDRASDVEAARANRTLFVGCDYGHGYRDEIDSAGPVVSSFGDLPAVIDSLLD
jgi:phosphoglycolate phosphatase-like HAD superfamily hydrolase